MFQILVIDDDEMILRLIKNVLANDTVNVTTTSSFTSVNKELLKYQNLIILDVMMPDRDGFDIMKEIRDEVDCPILFLTAKTKEEDMVYGFGLGADDYIKKPFSPEELKARVSAHLRRERREHHVAIKSGDVVFDLKAMEITVDKKKISLTKGEYQICEFLVRNKGQVFSREKIYEAVFGFDGESNDSTIATHIKNIRGKFEKCGEEPIETVWGIGYKWKK